MKNLRSMLPNEIEDILAGLGEPKYRAKQVFKWLGRGIGSIDEMSDIPKSLREKLKTEYTVYEPKVLSKQVSKIDGTIKYLWELPDGNCIETVLMQYHHGNTVCISSQVGCRMGCAFCASTIGGLVRRLEPYEMLDEVLFTQVDSGLPISHIVLMGIGEPLDNFDNVMRFLELVNSPEGMNISMRHISLSTCGLVPKMYQFAEENLPVTLSVSLHAPNDEIRRQTMPVANAYPMDELLAACRNYIDKTGRRIIFEYALVGGVNCEEKHAIELASRLRGMQCHVNLIPLNAVEERHLKGVNEQTVQRFLHKLEELHISATRRREMGDDIEGACGQLRRKTLTTLHDPQGEEA